MEISLNTSKWYDRLWAALIFFTRLPFWRIYQPPKEAYQGVVEFWPLAGWLTAGVMAGVLYGASMVFSYEIAVVLAIISRLLLTIYLPLRLLGNSSFTLHHYHQVCFLCQVRPDQANPQHSMP